MSAIIIDGKAVAARLREGIARDVAAMTAQGSRAPGLAVVLCGDNAASAIYVRNKGRAAEKVGFRFQLHTCEADTSTADLLRLVARLNTDEAVDGVLVQLPLPSHVDPDVIADAIAPDKDADGFNPANFGRLLRSYDVPISGSRAVVVGRSLLVGRPLALLLTNADATVTVCHSRTRDLPGVCREADILVTATGRPGVIDAGYVKPGACVIDVGTTPRDGTVVGDVDRESVEPVAGWLTPVPGGVGPMTIAMLLRNTLSLATARRRSTVVV